MPVGREMPRYKCHKEVWALKIDRVEHFNSGDAYDDMLAEAQDEDQPADDDDDELFQRAGVATIVAGDDE